MPHKSGRSSKANPHAEVNQHKYHSISETWEKENEWKMWPSSCINGKVFILFHGHLITYEEFIKLQPNPNISDYKVDVTNIDSTTTCLQ